MKILFELLFIVGIIVIGIYRDTRKKKAKLKNKTMPVPKNYNRNVSKNHKKTTTQQYGFSTPTTTLSQEYNTGGYTKKEEPVTDFSIKSLSDVQRAIVWGEILQRKF